jgi:hypothetical protein
MGVQFYCIVWVYSFIVLYGCIVLLFCTGVQFYCIVWVYSFIVLYGCTVLLYCIVLARGMERRELEEYFKVDINKMSFGDGKWIKLAESMVQLWDFISKSHWTFLASRTRVSQSADCSPCH